MDRARRNSTDVIEFAAGPVLVLDDDAALCEAISLVLGRAGFQVVASGNPRSFVGACLDLSPSCILLDVVLPGASGFDILRELQLRDCRAPVLMISGRSDIATAVGAIKQGAADFIEKPFGGDELIARVKAAIASRSDRGGRPIFVFPGRPPLTLREQDVLAELVAGRPTREVAERLKLSPRTVESHRARIIRKVGAKNPAELVRLAMAARRT